MATPNAGVICSICLRNTQNWNCLGRDYRFGRWSSGRERKKEVILGTPTHIPLPAYISLSLSTLSNDNSKKPFVCWYGPIDPFSAKENVCIFSFLLLVSYLTRFGVETKHYYPECSQNKMTKSKINKIRKTHRQFMLLTHTNKHKE